MRIDWWIVYLSATYRTVHVFFSLVLYRFSLSLQLNWETKTCFVRTGWRPVRRRPCPSYSHRTLLFLRTGWQPVRRRPCPSSAPCSSRARWRSSTRRIACPRPPPRLRPPPPHLTSCTRYHSPATPARSASISMYIYCSVIVPFFRAAPAPVPILFKYCHK